MAAPALADIQTVTETVSPPSRGRIIALDGLRGLAILAVVLFHNSWVLSEKLTALRLLRKAAYLGWLGVDLFFVLSGFSITGILLNAKGSTHYFLRFYKRRALRIFPLYYAVLLAIVIVSFFWQHLRMALPSMWPVFFYYFNWLAPYMTPLQVSVVGPFWTLAVEEQFYLVWPLLVWLIPRRHTGKLCLFGCAVALLTRAILISLSGPSNFIYLSTVTRMDALFWGSFAAVLARDASFLKRLAGWLPALGAVLFALPLAVLLQSHHILYSQYSAFTQTVGYALFAASFACFILWIAEQGNRGSERRFLAMPWLSQIGLVSYGLYVFHAIVFFAMGRWIDHHGVVLTDHARYGLIYIAAGFSVSWGLATLSYRFLERPLLRA